MHATHQLHKGLKPRIFSRAAPRDRYVVLRAWLIAAGLLILIGVLLAVGIIGGAGAAAILRQHAEQIKECASQVLQ